MILNVQNLMAIFMVLFYFMFIVNKQNVFYKNITFDKFYKYIITYV